MNSPFRATARTPSANLQMPSSYRRTARWIPRIGDIFPNFCAETTRGTIDFHSWSRGKWVMLFSHPFVRGPVGYSELANLARKQAEFDRRGVRILGLCNAGATEHRNWEREIEAMYDTEIKFPVIADTTHELSEAFGMIHPNEGRDIAIRKTFVIGPDLKLRMLFEYPVFVGRSTTETLRVIDALRMKDAHYVGTPADWQPGQPVLVPPSVSDAEAERAHPEGIRFVTAHMRMVTKSAPE